MNEIVGPSWPVAAAAFFAVALGVLALVLLWEGFRRVKRQSSLHRELKKLAERSERGVQPSGLLRDRERSGPAWLEAMLFRVPHRKDLANFLSQGDVRWGVGSFILLTVGLAAATGLAITIVSPGVPALAGAAVAATLPYLYVSRRRKKRFAKFEEHFPEAIDLLGRAIRAGHAFSTGLEIMAQESPEPIASEFTQVFEEQKFGLPLNESLLALSDRVAILDVRIFITAVMIQRDSGGNLAEILDNLAYVIRQRFKFRRQLSVHTAHGRMTGYVLAAAPLAAGLGMYILNPSYMRVLFEEPLGRIILAIAITLQFFGFLVIRRLVDIKF